MTAPPGAARAGGGSLGPPVPPGRSSFDLPLGATVVRVLDLPTAWEPFVPEHYAPFASPPDPERRPDLTVRCRQGEGVVVPLPPRGGSTALEIAEEGERRFRIRSHWQDGYIDLAAGTAEITFTERAEAAFRMSLENFLRVAGQLMLVEREAFMLHAAGVLDEDRCFLFFGPSGAGKTTATRNSSPRPALSDDMVVIDLSTADALAVAVPFFGRFPRERRVRGSWKVAAALRLRQAPADRLEPLSVARAVATVSASVPFVHELGLRHEGLTELVARFCDRVIVADLHLTDSPRFWSVLDGFRENRPSR